mmetsp:Transcript_4630/g.8193  ORF Transcript_4630/g.8193 Transcript_4630/m.8193 type:complete len:114 (+) Transcript_4630:58-399(+)|eukprot:CAMPEP_0197651444 /NCGR_PEP_ID=MMETSP1338-20131121/32552_1 /TAXON_ID=43686 ORGANISM="Pelagodinium beii, Strain RCC1491" /NCGR_SAMPLE_ID=MMETSP1338 /ASSEMBLY_ACC=CAM_ASM_000754 /LENGTH=113 /DNA_ID=CAMNT_0043226075 /DNA_START=58 /DNA_END=399 /DNA_ORIENTATION=+
MPLLRNAARLASSSLRAAAPMSTRPCVRSLSLPASRGFVTRSLPRMGHNLEDHYDFAEFMCKMHSPLGEYLIWAVIFSTFLVTFGPLLHSNYYFTGRFLPKDQGNSQLCDDSW